MKKPSIFIIFLLAPFASICAVLFAPALPEIAKQFNISDATAQMSMTLFLFGYAFGNLPYGILANRFGRKPSIFGGTLLAALGSLLVIYSAQLQMFNLFLVGRFLSALGSSVGMKISFTMIGDAFDKDEATKKIALTMLAFAIAPGIAVAFGGFLTAHFGWVSCFYALLYYSLFLFLLTFLLPETAKEKDKDALNFTRIRTVYGRKLKNTKLLICALIMGSATSIIYLFSTLAPFIGINYLGLSTEKYGLLNFLPPVGMVCGSLATHWLATRKEKLSAMQLGAWIALGVIVPMFLLFYLGKVNVWTLFLPMPFIYFGLSIVFANASGYAMIHAIDKSNASAIMNFINMMVSVVALFLCDLLPTGVLYAMPLLFLFFGLIMLLLRSTLRRT